MSFAFQEAEVHEAAAVAVAHGVRRRQNGKIHDNHIDGTEPLEIVFFDDIHHRDGIFDRLRHTGHDIEADDDAEKTAEQESK